MSGSGRKLSRKSLVEDFLRERRPAEVTAEVLVEMRRYVADRLGGAPVSDPYLLDLVEDAGVRVERSLGGVPPDLRNRVQFHDLPSAEASLRDMQQEYAAALAAGDRERAGDCRRVVLRAKRRLDILLRRNLDEAKRAEKNEIRMWFRVWLENPELFSDWVVLRKRQL